MSAPSFAPSHQFRLSSRTGLFSAHCCGRRLRSQKMQARTSGGRWTVCGTDTGTPSLSRTLLDFVSVADGPAIEIVRDLPVGDQAAAPHGVGEVGMGLQPPVDRSPRDVEGLGEVVVGGAGQAELVGLLDEFLLEG